MVAWYFEISCLFFTHIFIWTFFYFCIYWPCPFQFWFYFRKFLLGAEPWPTKTLGVSYKSSHRLDCSSHFIRNRYCLLGEVAKPLPVLTATLQLACHSFQLVHVGSFFCSHVCQIPHCFHLFSPTQMLTPACLQRITVCLVTTSFQRIFVLLTSFSVSRFGKIRTFCCHCPSSCFIKQKLIFKLIYHEVCF